MYDDIMATRKIDWVNNYWKVLANHPPTLRRMWANTKEVMGPGALDPLTKELIYMAVSVTNGCGYCIASHGAAARKKGMTPEQHAELIAIIGLANETNRHAVRARSADRRSIPVASEGPSAEIVADPRRQEPHHDVQEQGQQQEIVDDPEHRQGQIGGVERVDRQQGRHRQQPERPFRMPQRIPDEPEVVGAETPESKQAKHAEWTDRSLSRSSPSARHPR